MDFDGSSDYISLSDDTFINTTSPFTISGWFNLDSIDSGGYSAAFAFKTNSNHSFVAYISNQVGYVGVAFGEAGSGNAINTSTNVSSLFINKWANLTITYNGSGISSSSNYNLYINGQAQTLTSNTGFTGYGNVNLLGYYHDTGFFNGFNGSISNLAIWNTDQSVNKDNIYNNGSPQTSYTVTPQNWWKLNATSVYTPSAPNYTTALDYVNTSSPYGNYSNNTSSIISGNADRSISFWYKADSAPTSTNPHYPVSLGDLGSTNNTQFAILLSTSAFFRILTKANDSTYFNTSITFDDLKCHHMVISYSALNASVYIDGQLQGTVTFSNNLATNNGINIARSFNTPGGANGNVSNVAVYDSALTASQVSTLFNFGTPETSISFNPLVWYKLDNKTTGSQSNGSLTGSSYNLTHNGTVNEVSSSVAVIPSWKITSALPITTTPNYTTALDFVGGTTAGSGHSIDISSYTGLSNTSAFTVSIWFKGEDFSTDWIFSTSIAGDFGSNVIGLDLNNSGQLRPNILFNGTSANISNVDIDLNKWYHAAITYDGSTGIATMYVNTVAYAGTNNLGSTTPTFSNNLVIAALEFRVASPSLGYYFDGLLSNMAIFNTALPATGSNSIEALYNNGTPLVSMSSFSSLQAWWKLDNLATGIQDSSGNGYNGSNSGATQVTSDVLAPQPVNGVSTTLPSTALQQSDLQFDSPYSNYSLSFDGNSYIDTNFTLPASYSSFSYSFWFKRTTSANPGTEYIISNLVAPGNNNQARGLIRFGGTNLRIQGGDGTSPDYDTGNISATAILDQNWHHVSVTFVSGEIKTYFDGSLVNTYTNAAIVTGYAADRTYVIGQNGIGSGYLVNSMLDELAIFNKKLTEAEILSIYNNGKPGDISTLSPTNWWRLGENAYFVNNDITLPNSISGAPNGVSSGTATSMLSADAPGTYANGVGTNLDIVDRVGDAALSVANSQSYNMIPSDISPYVPEYVGDQISNAFEMTFDGVDDYITVSQINLGTTNTISLWYNGEVINYCALLGNDDAPNDYAVWVNNGTTVSYKVQDASNGVVDWNVTNVNDGDWHHFAFSRTNTTINFYIDGNLQTVNSNNLANNDTKIDTIGAKTNGSYPFKGKLDEVAIFDKALTADQVKFDLYEPTATGTNQTADIANNPNLPTPVAWYRMVD